MNKNGGENDDAAAFFERFKSSKVKVWPVEKVRHQNGLTTITLVFQETGNYQSKSWASRKSFKDKSKEGVSRAGKTGSNFQSQAILDEVITVSLKIGSLIDRRKTSLTMESRGSKTTMQRMSSLASSESRG